MHMRLIFFHLLKIMDFAKKKKQYLRISHVTALLRHHPTWEINLTKTYNDGYIPGYENGELKLRPW